MNLRVVVADRTILLMRTMIDMINLLSLMIAVSKCLLDSEVSEEQQLNLRPLPSTADYIEMKYI